MARAAPECWSAANRDRLRGGARPRILCDVNHRVAHPLSGPVAGVRGSEPWLSRLLPVQPHVSRETTVLEALSPLCLAAVAGWCLGARATGTSGAVAAAATCGVNHRVAFQP